MKNYTDEILIKMAELLESQEYASNKCIACDGPAHPETGFVFSEKAMLCGACAKDFYDWYRKRMTNQNRVQKNESSSWNENASKSIIGD